MTVYFENNILYFYFYFVKVKKDYVCLKGLNKEDGKPMSPTTFESCWKKVVVGLKNFL